MVKLTYSAGQPKLITGISGDQTQASANVVQTAVGASTSTVYEQDRKYTRTVSATLTTTLTPAADAAMGGGSVQSLTPDVCIANGLNSPVSRVSNGTCRLLVTGPLGKAAQQREVSGRVAVEAVDEVLILEKYSGTAGTLRKHIQEATIAALAGKTASQSTIDIYSPFNLTSLEATKNASCWFPGDFSHSTVKCAGGSQRMGMHFISKRHALFSWHVTAPSYFSTVYVRRKNGTIATANLVSYEKLGPYDMGLAYFDIDITGIDYATLAPPEITGMLGALVSPTPVPMGYKNSPILTMVLAANSGNISGNLVVSTNSRHARLQAMNIVRPVDGTSEVTVGGTTVLAHMFLHAVAATFEPELQPWTHNPIPGDSSSATYMLINGTPVLVGLQASTAGGDWIPPWTDVLPTIMDEMAVAAGEVAPNYAVNVADLSGFTVATLP